MRWQPETWRKLPIQQQPNYEDKESLTKTLQYLKKLPPLVTVSEVEKLQAQLSEVCLGNAFLLQGGDCAESFAEFSKDNLLRYFRVILQMTVALIYGTGKPVVKIGRIAGQFAKPRSSDYEEKSGLSLPSYRGDIVNNIEFDENLRVNDPKNMVDAYFQSATTLNFLRSLSMGGEASLKNIDRWNDDFITKNNAKDRFENITKEISDYVNFISACRIALDDVAQLNTADFFISHEGLLLDYEECFLHQDEKTGKFYNLSSHFLWVGERTRSLDGAHIEFFRGIANPIASKLGPKMGRDELLKLIETLNPENEPGRLTLISRMGADVIEDKLPPLVEAVRDAGLNVIWSSDPMHGNTEKSEWGFKTRPFEKILSEVKSFFNIHQKLGTYAGGIHLEMTGQDVTECTGGLQNIADSHLKNRYHTHCDPRLNGTQSLELAFLISEMLKL